MANNKTYKIQITGRGEDMIYTDGDLELILERTYCKGHRLYCSNFSEDHDGHLLSFSKRREIIENLCDHFNTLNEASIFVLDIADKDRRELDKLFSQMADKGHKIIVEHDSFKRRERLQDEMYIGLLKAGKKLTINGHEIECIEDYWAWKKDG